MCASYGLGGGSGKPLPADLPPMSDPANLTLLAEWADQRKGRAAITGKNALNLNPLIHAPEGERRIDLGWWWLWRDPSGPVKYSAFNSRDDKLLRSWKGPFQHRAILPATWYVEKKVRFSLPDDELFGIAALTSTVTLADGTQRLSYSMVTRDAVGEAADTWPRMPLVLPREMHDEWLDPARPGDESLVAEARLASEEISRDLAGSAPAV